MRPRHDAKFSVEVLAVLRDLAGSTVEPVEGLIFDPFAGVGLIDQIGRDDVAGIDLEPEFAAGSPVVEVGNALDPGCYPDKVGAFITSPTYGNRMADRYRGPVCGECAGAGEVPEGSCPVCSGSGRDGRRRFGYTISLGRPPSLGSSAGLQWGRGYRVFHYSWLKVAASKVDEGPRRLILNMSDHYRGGARQYVCHWWVEAAGGYGFRLVNAVPVPTSRIGEGQNREARAEREMVFVFDYTKDGRR